MQHKEVGIILSIKPLSESARVVTFFNESWGKISAVFRNIKTPIQKGDICDIFWRGASLEGLGNIKIEMIFSPFGYSYKEAAKVFAIDSACTMCSTGLLFAAPHKNLFTSLMNFILALERRNWIEHYIAFEVSLLAEVGYGLDLSKCAISGSKTGLCFVSPKTGRAVTKEVGWAYRDRLLPLPKFMTLQNTSITSHDIFCALNLTEHFLKTYFWGINEQQLPLSREYMKNIVATEAGENSDINEVGEKTDTRDSKAA